MKIPISTMTLTLLIGLLFCGHAMDGQERKLDQITVTKNPDWQPRDSSVEWYTKIASGSWRLVRFGGVGSARRLEHRR
jgi:hypothetical protein